MISLIRNPNGTIKSFSEHTDPQEILSKGESIEYLNTSFAEYAQRLMLTAAGKSGETVRVSQASGDLTVEIRCPGETSVALDINGAIETLPIIDGQSALLLGTEEAGTFIIQPADTTRYCAAGQSLLVIEVV